MVQSFLVVNSRNTTFHCVGNRTLVNKLSGDGYFKAHSQRNLPLAQMRLNFRKLVLASQQKAL